MRYSLRSYPVIKFASIAYILFCVGFCLMREWGEYRHYLVINRDYFPIMSDFYAAYAGYAIECLHNCIVCYLTLKMAQFSRLFASENLTGFDSAL
jgi:hypothetical protein